MNTTTERKEMTKDELFYIIKKIEIKNNQHCESFANLIFGIEKYLQYDICENDGVVKPRYYLFDKSNKVLAYVPDEFDSQDAQQHLAILKKYSKKKKSIVMLVIHAGIQSETKDHFAFMALITKNKQLIFSKNYEYHKNTGEVEMGDWEYCIHPASKDAFTPDYRNIIIN